jgi:hypothetical protein
MIPAARTLWWVILAIASLGWTTGAALRRSGTAEMSSFCPAYLSQVPKRLELFPRTGWASSVGLPADLPGNFRVIAFSPDGKAIYGQEMEPIGRQVGITEIEFKPPRKRMVPGSAAFSNVVYLAVSLSSGKIFVAGWSGSAANSQCGVFEIDPGAASHRKLWSSPSLDCPGPLSPDGKRAVSMRGQELGVLDLETGTVQTIKGASGVGACTWSPEGRQLACIDRDEKIVLIETSTRQTRIIGGSGNGLAEWSPDSKSLLVIRDQFSCLPTLFGASLAVVDVETGKRSWVKSAHCKVMGGSYYGWVDREAVQ